MQRMEVCLMAAKTTDPTAGPKHRSTKSGVKVHWSSAENPLMNLTFEVDFIAPKQGDDKYESVCPSCHVDDPDADGVKLDSKYHCPANADHGPFAYGDVARGTPVGKTLRVVGTVDEVKAARTVIEDGDPIDLNLFLSPYKAEQVEAATYPIGTAYVLRPTDAYDKKVFPLFLQSVDHDGRIHTPDGVPITLIGEVAIRKSPKLMQVRRWGDQLVLQELARPDDLKTGFGDHDISEVTDKAVLGFAGFLVAEALDFDPDAFANQRKASLRAFTERRLEEGPDAQIIAMPKRDNAGGQTNKDDDLFAMLEASVKATKRPAKKAASARKKAS